jgi:hypothetical protein
MNRSTKILSSSGRSALIAVVVLMGLLPSVRA